MSFLILLFVFSVQHLHDPHVKLRQWSAGVVPIWEWGEVCTVLDKPPTEDSPTTWNSQDVLWGIPGWRVSYLEGKGLFINLGFIVWIVIFSRLLQFIPNWSACILHESHRIFHAIASIQCLETLVYHQQVWSFILCKAIFFFLLPLECLLECKCLMIKFAMRW